MKGSIVSRIGGLQYFRSYPVLFVLLFLVSISSGIQLARAENNGVSGSSINILKGEQKNVALEAPLEKINVSSKGVVSVFVQDPSTLVLRGIGVGTAKLLLQYSNGTLREYDVVGIGRPTEELKVLTGQIAGYLSVIKGVKVEMAGDKIILSGDIDDERYEDYYAQIVGMYCDEVTDLIRGYSCSSSYTDDRSVLNEAVQIDAQIVEIRRDDSENLGFQWFSEQTPWTASVKSHTGTSDGSTSSGSGSSSGTSTPTATMRFGTFDADVQDVTAKIIALVDEGKAKFIATPKLVVQSGEEASFAVGGEIPIAQLTAMASTVDWKKYGTQLKIAPNVLKGNRIFVNVAATVSELDYTNKVNGYPALRSKDAQTNVVVREGETLAIAGLLSEEKNDGISKVPFLGDIPFLGYLFKKKSNTKTRTETIVLVTPHVVKKNSLSRSESYGVSLTKDMKKTLDEFNASVGSADKDRK